eukprot:TRINITY_DN53733_c0_g1_i1.p1 TRINITY_DN53733_c0_g1~~TRINITY_DN53733_c0_g1_i1.p1  ORF type:complete len:438 (-),score=143.51 TRINITY_DN53733_c0_g1_i1:152-1465(-)
MTCLSLLLLLLSPSTLLCSDCEVCDLTDQLDKVKRELADCQVKLTDQSYLGQVCNRVGSWIGKDSSPIPLQSTVKKLLSHLDLLSSPLDPKSNGVERDLLLKLTNQELRDLRKFVLNDDGSPGKVEDILVRSLQPRDGWMDQTSEFVSQTFGETSLHFKANYVIIFQVSVLLCGVILPLLLTKNKWRIIPYITFFLCMYAVLTTWIRQYYTAAAKKQATLAKHANIPNSCLLEKQGWLSAAQDFVTGLFNGKVDPCEAYYTAAMVDPAFEVGLISAVIETFSVCIVLPAQTLGLALGSYYSCLLEPLPWVWKVPVMVLATVLVLFLLLLTCGYEFRIPFLLSIGPGRKRNISGQVKQVGGEGRSGRHIGDEAGNMEGLEYRRQSSHDTSRSPGNSPWRFERHPSEECDMTDKGGKLPYPVKRTELDDLIEGPQRHQS